MRTFLSLVFMFPIVVLLIAHNLVFGQITQTVFIWADYVRAWKEWKHES